MDGLATWAAQQARPGDGGSRHGALLALEAVEAERSRLRSALDRSLLDAGLTPSEAAPSGRRRSRLGPGPSRPSTRSRQRGRERARLTELESDLARRARVAAALKQELARQRASRSGCWTRSRSGPVRDGVDTAAPVVADSYSLSLDDRGGFAVIGSRQRRRGPHGPDALRRQTFLASLALALALAGRSPAPAGVHRTSSRSSWTRASGDAGRRHPRRRRGSDGGPGAQAAGWSASSAAMPELAERVPVRFEVRRGARGSDGGQGGAVRFAVEAWARIQLANEAGAMAETEVPVDLAVERPAADWAPITPSPGPVEPPVGGLRGRRAPVEARCG